MTSTAEPSPPLAYLDHAATTPLRPQALDAMVEALRDHYGNPSGVHAVARDARRLVDEARDTVAWALGCAPGEVVFTGCGTEADNTAVLGALRRRGGVAVCSAVEHHAVLHPVELSGGKVVAVDATGRVDLDAVSDALDDEVTVVSVMAVNNEVGTIEPLGAVVEVVRDRAPQALVHTDAVQAVAWLDVAQVASGCDLVSISAHKFGGPKGVGVLVHRGRADVEPLLLGGGQERDRRSGTHNVAGIVGLAAALRATVDERDATVARLKVLRDRLLDGLADAVPGVVETVPRSLRVAGSAHVCVDGVDSESLLFLLDRGGVAASAASACASGAAEPSHVLAAMGVAKEQAQGALRLSLGWATTDADIDRALEVIPGAVARLRA